jgi:signal peptidase I
MPPRTEGLLTQRHRPMNGLSQVSSGTACCLVAESVRVFGAIRLPAVGTSMVPAIQPGDVLTVQPVEGRNLSCGDIVVYARNQMLVVHRIVGTSADSRQLSLITRGDRLLRDDGPISLGDLIGQVTRIERQHRHVKLRPSSNKAEQALGAILRRSERATLLFLRAKELLSSLFSRGSVWQT